MIELRQLTISSRALSRVAGLFLPCNPRDADAAAVAVPLPPPLALAAERVTTGPIAPLAPGA